jgi:hypothetical protein
MVTNITEHENLIASEHDSVKSVTKPLQPSTIQKPPPLQQPMGGPREIPYIKSSLDKKPSSEAPYGLELLKIRGGAGVTVNPATKRQELSAFGTGWNSSRFEVHLGLIKYPIVI